MQGQIVRNFSVEKTLSKYNPSINKSSRDGPHKQIDPLC